MDEPGGGPAIRWLDAEPAALELAAAEGKPVLLDFWAPWCKPCQRMLDITFADPQVVAESGRFVCAKVDVAELSAEDLDRMLKDYGVQGVPTTVLIGTDGRHITLVGEKAPAQLLPVMQSVR